MQDLKAQEIFEIEVLDRLNSKRILPRLVFCGGTMLRLCYGLNRYSVDLDFWVAHKVPGMKLFKDMRSCLEESYLIKDAANKFHMLLFEIKSRNYPRSLKIEVRKEPKKISVEQTIAYSRHTTTQVLLKAVSLNDCLKSKIEAFLDRREIRDIFDLEFLLKRGVPLNISPAGARTILKAMEAFSVKEYTVKLGSLLEEPERKYYARENFKLLKSALAEAIN